MSAKLSPEEVIPLSGRGKGGVPAVDELLTYFSGLNREMTVGELLDYWLEIRSDLLPDKRRLIHR